MKEIVAEVDRQGEWANRALEILRRRSSSLPNGNEDCEGLCAQVCELHFTALLAMREGYVGGALTLVRPTFECLQRAIWLHNDHDAVADFRTGAVPNFSELRAKIAEKLGTLPGPFGDIYDRVKTAHALTHGGRELVTAHFADSKVRTLDYQLNLLRWFKGLAGFAMQLRGMIVLRQSDLEELQKTLLDGFP